MDHYVRRAHRSVYRNAWVEIEVHDIVHPTGALGEHVLVVTPPAVGVLVEDGDTLIFARQPRFGARREFVEIVKGGADAGEMPLDAARRELREELGLEARLWEALGEVFEIPSIVASPVTLFVARDLTRVPSEPEAVERIAETRMSAGEAIARARSGELSDAVTLAALLRYSKDTPAPRAPR